MGEGDRRDEKEKKREIPNASKKAEAEKRRGAVSKKTDGSLADFLVAAEGGKGARRSPLWKGGSACGAGKKYQMDNDVGETR